MKIDCFVEGPSDATGLRVLRAPLLRQKAAEGIAVDFFPAVSGDRKRYLVTQLPIKAVNILVNNLDDHVAIVPDLYPPNKGFPHQTRKQLIDGIQECFRDACRRKRVDDERVINRFHAFCFQYEFEVLLLAAEDSLRFHLGDELKRSWTKPPEEQNHNQPPKTVLQDLFQLHNKSFGEIRTAVAVLERAAYQDLKTACPLSFGPFVSYLESVA